MYQQKINDTKELLSDSELDSSLSSDSEVESTDSEVESTDSEVESNVENKSNKRTIEVTDRSIKKRKINFDRKLYDCSICGKQLKSKLSLANHIKIHNGTQPFNCTRCSKKFCSKSLLKAHIRIHTGEKPFSCDGSKCLKPGCTESFRTKQSLNRHIGRGKAAKGIYDYPCMYCDVKCHCAEYLTTHIRVAHKKIKKKINCVICNKNFMTNELLTNHIRKKHVEKTPPKSLEIPDLSELSKTLELSSYTKFPFILLHMNGNLIPVINMDKKQ